eukprot:gene4668-8240_t
MSTMQPRRKYRNQVSGTTTSTTPKTTTIQQSQEGKLKILTEKIIQAIEEKKNGNPTNYNKLVSNINALNTSQISDVYIVLTSIVYLINEETKELLQVIFSPKVDLWYIEPKEGSLMDVYIKLVLSILSRCPSYLTPFLQVLASNMIDKSGKDELSKIKFNNVHNLLKYLNNKISQCSLILFDVVKRLFPINERTHEYCQYITNLLYLSEYCTTIRNQVLSFIISQIMNIDVHLKDGFDQEEEEDEDDALFELELGNGGNQQQNDNKDKLDTTMMIIFEFIDKNADENIFKNLMTIFVKQVLMSYNPTIIQFIWFFLCSKKTEYTKQFLDFLIDKTLDSNVHIQIRKNASNFLGGFLARSNFVKQKKSQLVFEKLSKWMKLYVLEIEKTRNFEYKNHPHFYSVFNSVLYALCFKMDEKMNLEDLIYVCNSQLNPLRIVSKEISIEFQKKYKIIFKNAIKPPPKIKMQISKDLIDDFYPFDPYTLPKSVKFIQPLFQNWSSHLATKDKFSKSIGSRGRSPMSGVSFRSEMSFIETYSSCSYEDGFSSATDTENDTELSEKFGGVSFEY